MRRRGWVLGAMAAWWMTPGSMAQPKLQNVQQQARAVTGSVEATVRGIVAGQKEPAWIAYAAPMIAGERQMCCWSDDSPGCALEPRGEGAAPIAPSGTVHLEGGTEFYIFLRVENQRVEKVRTFSMDCAVDGGGLPLYWLTGGTAASSLQFLASLVPQTNLEGERRLASGAIAAMALHKDPAADGLLDRLAQAEQPETVRRQAIQWLGRARGRHGYETLAKLVREEPNDGVREMAMEALGRTKQPEAIGLVVRVAKEDRSARVRGRALHWLARRAPKATAEAAIRGAIEQDSEAGVKRQAVSALVQMPEGAGIPLLMELARGTKNEAVRKQALAALSHSKDARAAKFFEDVLAAR